MIFTDTHAHIYAHQFDDDLKDVLSVCSDLGVTKIYMPNIDVDSIEPMLAVEQLDPTKYIPMMGLHPCSVKANYKEDLKLIRSWFDKRDFVAVGEMGIDLYWDKTFIEEQKDAFRIQCQWANEFNKPIVIHARESLDVILDLLDEISDPDLTGVFHCFSGTIEQTERALGFGFYLGIGGVSTFKNGGLDKILPEVSLDRIVLETDSPYLAPVPHRGKRNEPSYIPIIANRISEIMNIPVSKVAEQTTTNAANLFKISE